MAEIELLQKIAGSLDSVNAGLVVLVLFSLINIIVNSHR